MPRANPVRRITSASASYDYPPARSSVSESNYSEDLDWTIDDQRPLSADERPRLAPLTLEHINRLRAERLEATDPADLPADYGSETWDRSARRNAEQYIRQAEAAVAAALYPRESHARTLVHPTHSILHRSRSSYSRSRMRRVLSNIRDTESAFQEADPYPPARRSGHRRRRADLHRRHMSHRMEDRDSADLHERAERLAQQNEDINTLIASTPGLPPRHGLRRPRSVSFDTSTQHDRRKRRRIENTAVEVNAKIEYGWWGQVVSGKLQMHIVSSDGEMMPLPRPCEGTFAVENVLKDDQTIYYTNGTACNIVLRHEGDTPFSLERLVIKGPTMGFTDSVQEGLVFLSMQRDEKFIQTTAYKILHFPESYFGRFYPHAKNHRYHRRSSVVDPSWPSLEPAYAGPVPRATAVSDRDQAQVDSNACADDSSSDSYMGLEVDDESGSNTSDTSTSSHDDAPEPRQRGDTPVTYRTFFEEERFRDELRGARRRRDPTYNQTREQYQRRQHQYQRDQQVERDIEQIVAQGEQTRADRFDRRLNRTSSAALPQQSHDFPQPPPALRRAFARRLQNDLDLNPLTTSYYPRNLDATDQALYRNSVLDMGRSEGITDPPPNADQLRPRSIDIDRETLPNIGPTGWSGQPVTLPRGPARSVANRIASPLQNVAGVDDVPPEAVTDCNKLSGELNLLAPAARFSMRQRPKKGRNPDDSANTMTIQFEPPISGKYILLKLWNPHKDRTIDVQNVAAYGFAGPRYFPAWEFA